MYAYECVYTYFTETEVILVIHPFPNIIKVEIVLLLLSLLAGLSDMMGQ